MHNRLKTMEKRIQKSSKKECSRKPLLRGPRRGKPGKRERSRPRLKSCKRL
jgi:hypothetical protein